MPCAGRLWEFISNGNSYFLSLHALRMVVIDEADRMLTSGHFKELQVLGPLYVLHSALCPPPCFRLQPLEHAACSAGVLHFL